MPEIFKADEGKYKQSTIHALRGENTISKIRVRYVKLIREQGRYDWCV